MFNIGAQAMSRITAKVVINDLDTVEFDFGAEGALTKSAHIPGTFFAGENFRADGSETAKQSEIQFGYHCVLQLAEPVGEEELGDTWRVQFWINHGVMLAPASAFKASIQLQVRGSHGLVETSTSRTVHPGEMLSAVLRLGRVDAFRNLNPKTALMLDTVASTPITGTDGVSVGREYFLGETHHQTGLAGQFPACTPGELASSLDSKYKTQFMLPRVSVALANANVARIYAEREPGYFSNVNGAPFFPQDAGMENVDMWESGPSGHRRYDAETYGWDAVGGPKSKRGFYSAEHFGRAVDYLFDLVMQDCDQMAHWMLRCKMGAITSYGWDEFRPGDGGWVWSARAWGWVMQALLKWLFVCPKTQTNWFSSCLRKMLGLLESEYGEMTPDGAPKHPMIPFGPRSTPEHGHGTWDKSQIKHWATQNPNGPKITDWPGHLEDEAYAASYLYQQLEDQIAVKGIEAYQTPLYWLGKGDAEFVGSSDWLQGWAFYRYFFSTCVWMNSYIAHFVARFMALKYDLENAGVPQLNLSQMEESVVKVRRGLVRLFAVAGHGAGLIPPSDMGFHRDIQPRVAEGNDEHQGDYGLARVTMDGVYALGRSYPADTGIPRALESAMQSAKSVYMNADRCRVGDDKTVIGSEVWYAVQAEGVRE